MFKHIGGMILLLGALFLLWGSDPIVEKGQGSAAVAPRYVTESELQLYIDVYQAMQGDHRLTIEQALQPHGMSVRDFRVIEQHVQDSPGMVDQVRDALLEYAQHHSTLPDWTTGYSGVSSENIHENQGDASMPAPRGAHGEE